jgi:hypothetical protein
MIPGGNTSTNSQEKSIQGIQNKVCKQQNIDTLKNPPTRASTYLGPTWNNLGTVTKNIHFQQ